MADLAIPTLRKGRPLTPEEFARLLAGGPTYTGVSRPDVGPYGTGSNRGADLPAPMGGLFGPAYDGPVSQNPVIPAKPAAPVTPAAQTELEK